jgi:F0F1-type ATP synthase assembly protein I
MSQEKSKTELESLKNPSFKVTKEELEERQRLEELRLYLNHLRHENEEIREQWHKYYSRACLVFFITGILIGFIVGILL